MRTTLVALSFLAVACDGPTLPAPVDPPPATLLSTCLRYPETIERTFRSDAEWQEAHRGFGRPPAPPVDFSRSMVAAHFDGPGSACTTFSVEAARMEDGVLRIDAVRHVFTGPCILAIRYPQLIVAVDRHDGPVQFLIREVAGEMFGPARACY